MSAAMTQMSQAVKDVLYAHADDVTTLSDDLLREFGVILSAHAHDLHKERERRATALRLKARDLVND